MTSLPEADEPDAVDSLHRALRRLHRDRGAPSIRGLVRRIGRRRISHGTVHTALAGNHVVTWPKLLLIVQALEGDLPGFQRLWTAAHDQTLTSRKTVVIPDVSVPPAEDASAPPAVIAPPPAPCPVGEAGPAAAVSQVFAVDEFVVMLGNYRPPQDPVISMRKLVAKLIEIPPARAAELLQSLPLHTSATALAQIDRSQAEAIVEIIGATVLGDLITALPAGAADRDQLSRLYPEPPPGQSEPSQAATTRGDPLAMPADQGSAYVHNVLPELARRWRQ